MTGVAKSTVFKLLVDIGQACSAYQDETFHNLNCQRIQCDEIWSFCYAKEKNVPAAKQGTFKRASLHYSGIPARHAIRIEDSGRRKEGYGISRLELLRKCVQKIFKSSQTAEARLDAVKDTLVSVFRIGTSPAGL